MTSSTTSSDPLSYVGIDPFVNPPCITADRPPTALDIQNPMTQWKYLSFVYETTGAGNWEQIVPSGSGGGLTIANTDSGSAMVSSSALTFHGAGGISTSGSGSTLTITGSGGSGFTTANADSGAATVAADALTFHGAGGITTSGSGSTLTITGSGSGLTTANTDSGTATVAANALLFHGAGGLAVTGSGSTVTITGNGSPGIQTLSGTTGSATGSTVQLAGAGSVVTSATGAVVTITGNGATAVATQAGTANVTANGFSIVGSGFLTASASGSTVTIADSSPGDNLWDTINTTPVTLPANTNAFVIPNENVVINLPTATVNGQSTTIVSAQTVAFNISIYAAGSQHILLPPPVGSCMSIATNGLQSSITLVWSSSTGNWSATSIIGTWAKNS